MRTPLKIKQILIFIPGSSGDVFPMIALAAALRKRGPNAIL